MFRSKYFPAPRCFRWVALWRDVVVQQRSDPIRLNSLKFQGLWILPACQTVRSEHLRHEQANATSFPAATTHELGHGIGWRHSNAHYIGASTGADQACDPNVEECATTAIMNATAVSSLGYALQTWDVNAAQSVYPGGSCGPDCTPPSLTAQPAPATISAGASVTLSVTASGTSTLTYQWYQGPSGDTSNPVPGANTPSINVAPGTTTMFWVRVSNGCGSVDSAAATVTVSLTQAVPTTATKLYLVTPCRLIDTRGPNGAAGGPILGASSVRAVVAAGNCGLPAGAAAIVVNLTAVRPPSTGYLTAYPGTGSGPPGTSTLNYKKDKVLGNNAVVRLSSDV